VTELLILASSIATYGGLATVAKYAIDHDGHVREDLRHAAAFLLALAAALAAALAHLRSHR
jgi:hypothetical protein